ncbi:MAG: protein TolA [Hyphomicrobiaceae bacterium]|nr:protein TolA [Hyphomicrobiaceae bacterium]
MHVGVLAWALIAIHGANKLDMPDTPPLEVAIVTPSELTRMRQGDPDSKEMVAKAEAEPEKEISKKEAPKPKPVVAPPPPAPEPPPPDETAKAEPPPEPAKPEAVKPDPAKAPDPIADKIAALPPPPEPAPGPTPEQLKEIEAKKAAEEAKKAAEEAKKAADAKKTEEARKAEEKRKKAEKKKKDDERKKRLAEAKRKAAEAKKKQQFDPDRIAALIDKTPEKKGAPQRSNAPSPDATYKGPTAGTRDGTDTVLSAREQDLLRGLVRGQLRGCWHLPGGGGGSEIPIVTLRWQLKPDGTLSGIPVVEGGGSGPMFQIAVEAAQRAVLQCAPFTLPPDKYAAWKEIIWDFDPREML